MAIVTIPDDMWIVVARAKRRMHEIMLFCVSECAYKNEAGAADICHQYQQSLFNFGEAESRCRRCYDKWSTS